jgi:hypothetical protein
LRFAAHHPRKSWGKLVQMKRSLLLALALAMVFAGGASRAEHIAVDLNDYDLDLMRSLDQTFKYFEPDLADGNVKAYADDVQLVHYAFAWLKSYFEKKGSDADQAVKIAQQGLTLLDGIDKDVAAKNFDAAADKAHELGQTCRSCHDIYKPLQTRS